MLTKPYLITLLCVTGLILLGSCQKEINGSSVSGGGGTPAAQQPKVNTTWTYNYYTFYPILGGGVRTIGKLTLKARSEEILGGEKWLRVVDVDADTTFYYLQQKADGLYQYANGAAQLLCKQPAAVNDSYNTYNNGSTENFIVRGVNDTMPTAVGDIPVNFYEGTKSAFLIDQIWYNKDAWFTRKDYWLKLAPPSPLYYRYSAMFIESIVY